MSYTKIKNPWQFGDLKICILRSKLLSFLCRTVYRVFELDFLQVCGIHHWLHLRIFSQFLKTCKYCFRFFLKHRDHWCPGARNLLSLPESSSGVAILLQFYKPWRGIVILKLSNRLALIYEWWHKYNTYKQDKIQCNYYCICMGITS